MPPAGPRAAAGLLALGWLCGSHGLSYQPEIVDAISAAYAARHAPPREQPALRAGVPGARVHFVTYAAEGFEQEMQELCSEATASGLFSSVSCFPELPSAALSGRWSVIRSRQNIEPDWINRPALVQHMLRQLPQGDCLLFVEASAEISPDRRAWADLLELLAGSEPHVIAFQRSDSPEYESTKADVFREFGVWMNDTEVKSYKVSSSYYFIKNVRPAHLLLHHLATLMTDTNLLSDHPSHAPNHERFVAHGHDESLWSMLVKANRPGTACRNTYVVKDLRVKLLPYRGCDDLRNATSAPILAHCGRHRKGLKGKLAKAKRAAA